MSAALVAKHRFGVPLVLEVQDLWPQSLASTGMLTSSRLLRSIDGAMRMAYRQSDAVVVISEGFRSTLIASGLESEKVHVIHNWADEHRMRPTAADRAWAAALLDPMYFNVAFTGNIGPAQALETVLATAQGLKASSPEVRFHILGEGIERTRLEKAARTQGLTNVTFYARQSMGRAAAFVAASDAALVHLRADPLFTITIPSKTQGYLYIGAPILIGVAGESAELVNQAGAGISFRPEDAQSLAGAIQAMIGLAPSMRRAIGDSGKSFYEARMSVAAGLDQYERLFKTLIS